MRPVNLVNVLEQLPPDVVGTMVLRQLDGDDIGSFKLAAPSTLALVRRTSQVLHLGLCGAQEEFPDQGEIQSQARAIEDYEACIEVQLYVDMDACSAELMVGLNANSPRNGPLRVSTLDALLALLPWDVPTLLPMLSLLAACHMPHTPHRPASVLTCRHCMHIM